LYNIQGYTKLSETCVEIFFLSKGPKNAYYHWISDKRTIPTDVSVHVLRVTGKPISVKRYATENKCFWLWHYSYLWNNKW